MARKYRICIVMGSHWAHQMGGAQYQAKCIVDALQKAGQWEVHYVASLVAKDYKPNGYQVHKIRRFRVPDRFGGFIWDAPGLRQAVRAIEPDLIYQRGLKAHTGILGKLCAEMSIPFVFHIAHDDDTRLISNTELLRHSFNKWVNKRIGETGLHRASAIIAQTQHQAVSLKRNYGLEPALIAPNFHPLPDTLNDKAQGIIQVTWVANFKPSKQPHIFVDLAEALADTPVLRFVMIGRQGDPATYSGLHQRIDSLPNLRYLGEIPIERVNDELSKSHIFVNTSLSEGFPNTFIQAWMREVPVLSLIVDPDGLLERQRIGVCCQTFGKLCSETLRLAEDTTNRVAMGQRAAQWAEKVYGPAAGQAITDLLLQLASGGPSRHQAKNA